MPSPVATPDLIAFEQFFLKDLRPSEKLIEIVGMNLASLLFADRDLFGDFAAHRCDFAFEVPQARLPACTD